MRPSMVQRSPWPRQMVLTRLWLPSRVMRRIMNLRRAPRVRLRMHASLYSASYNSSLSVCQPTESWPFRYKLTLQAFGCVGRPASATQCLRMLATNSGSSNGGTFTPEYLYVHRQPLPTTNIVLRGMTLPSPWYFVSVTSCQGNVSRSASNHCHATMPLMAEGQYAANDLWCVSFSTGFHATPAFAPQSATVARGSSVRGGSGCSHAPCRRSSMLATMARARALGRPRRRSPPSVTPMSSARPSTAASVQSCRARPHGSRPSSQSHERTSGFPHSTASRPTVCCL
mmetsp:Transcript_89187/g.247677  ORF Transcript_89187/g.247677 Transcript_89187/m.247677 type:complete len:285 (+) Transcript_89187:235-1089(+)